MEENQEGVNGYLEKLALITDAIETIFPNAQSALIFELDEVDYRKMQSHFRKIDSIYKRFKIDISGVEVIFMIKGYIPDEVEEEETKPEEQKEDVTESNGLLKKILNLFTSKKSS